MKNILTIVICFLGTYLLSSCSGKKDEVLADDFLTEFVSLESDRLNSFTNIHKTIVYNSERQSKSISKNLDQEVLFLNEYLDIFRKTNNWDSLRNGDIPPQLVFSNPNGDSLWLFAEQGHLISLTIKNQQSSLFRDAETSIHYDLNKGYQMQESSNMFNLMNNKIEIVVEFPQEIQ